MPDKYAPCKRGCCWNNWGVCPKNRTCACHSPLAALVERRLSESSVNNTEPTVSSEPAPANVTPLFQEPTS